MRDVKRIKKKVGNKEVMYVDEMGATGRSS